MSYSPPIFFSTHHLILADCSDPGLDENGARTGVLSHGETLTYSCNEGYSLVGAVSLTCNDGAYDNEAPVCYGKTTYPCLIPPHIANDIYED